VIKLSDYIIQFVANLGVRHVFMLPGGFAMHLNDSVGRSKEIEYVCNLHEQACAIAAEAYARVTNNMGVAIVTAGPGATNAITGLTAAWLDSTPCLFLSGQVKRADIMGDLGVRQLGIQEIDIVSLVRNITKYAVTIDDPSRIRHHLEKAVYLAGTGRPGPVWIDVPLDVQAAMIDPDHLSGFDPDDGGTSMDQSEPARWVDEAIELLNVAERPVILAGNGVRLSGAEDAFLEFIDLLGIPVLTTRLGVDLIPASHDLCIGMPGSIAPRGANFALQNSDWLLVLGARLDRALLAFAPDKLARAAKKIMVDIDAAEIEKLSAIIDIPVRSDVQAFIQAFLGKSSKIKPKDRSGWIKRCREWKARYPFVLPRYGQGHNGLSTYVFSEALSDVSKEDDLILPGNAGTASEIFLTAFKVKPGQRVFHNKGTGAMGFSQPASIGACLASGGKRTICVDGDGGFQMNIQELETIKRLGLPIKFFVMNNRGYASIRASQLNFFNRLTGADESSGLTLPVLSKVVQAYGLPYARMDENTDLRGQIDRVLNRKGPVVCEVFVTPDEPREPRVSAIQKPDGSIVSKPLEDMYPYLDRDEFLSNMMIDPVDQ
jgi:acetolactate synthase-1/2/3 large subunit